VGSNGFGKLGVVDVIAPCPEAGFCGSGNLLVVVRESAKIPLCTGRVWELTSGR